MSTPDDPLGGIDLDLDAINPGATPGDPEPEPAPAPDPADTNTAVPAPETHGPTVDGDDTFLADQRRRKRHTNIAAGLGAATLVVGGLGGLAYLIDQEYGDGNPTDEPVTVPSTSSEWEARAGDDQVTEELTDTLRVEIGAALGGDACAALSVMCKDGQVENAYGHSVTDASECPLPTVRGSGWGWRKLKDLTEEGQKAVIPNLPDLRVTGYPKQRPGNPLKEDVCGGENPVLGQYTYYFTPPKKS